jgi:hypothetical protein
MDIREVSYFLTRLKYAPASIDEAEWLELARKQAHADLLLYGEIDDLQQKIDAMAQQQTQNVQMNRAMERLKEQLRSVAFQRQEVMGRDPRFVAQSMLPTFKQRLNRIAQALPTRLTMSFSNDISTYQYDFQNGVLYNRSLLWAPCNHFAGHGCLPNGQGSHFFAKVPYQRDIDRVPELQPYFVLVPNRLVMENANYDAYGSPSKLLTFGGVGDLLIAVDRIIGIPYLKMDAASAEALLSKPAKVEPGSCWPEAGGGGCNIVTEMAFTVDRIWVRERQGDVIFVKLDEIRITKPDGSLLKRYSATDFRASAEMAAEIDARKAEQARKTAEAEQAAKEAAAAESARVLDLDIVGLRIGMDYASADAAIRQRMNPSSVYRFNGGNEFKPFDRSYVYISVEGNPDEAPLPDICQQTHPSMKAKVEEMCRNMRQTVFWKSAVPTEVIALTVEKNAAGSETVLGVSRWLSLPANADMSAIRASLEKKYGAVVHEDRPKRGEFTLYWGKASIANNWCQPQSRKRTYVAVGDEPAAEFVSGLPIDVYPRFSQVAPASLYGSDLGAYQRPENSRFDQCSNGLSAHFEPYQGFDEPINTLVVQLADFKRYFEAYQAARSQASAGSADLEL